LAINPQNLTRRQQEEEEEEEEEEKTTTTSLNILRKERKEPLAGSKLIEKMRNRLESRA